MKTGNITEQPASHDHVVTHVHVVVQQHGVPYEIEQDVCSVCHAVLAERPLRRADG